MRVGISLPQLGPQALPDNLVKIARRAEELGYDSVWVLERLLWPIAPKEPYPAAPDGRLPETYQSVLDPIETLTFVAAHTTKVQLGTSVLVLPYHSPIELARRLASLDVLSKGRVLAGVGAGWSRDEFEAAGTPFERRGARCDEFLRAMIEIWTKDPVKFDGEFYHIPESMVGPKPVQKPYPPIYLAGFGQYTFDRAAKFGNGWNPAGIMSFEALEGMIKQFRQTAERAGRDNMEVVLRTFTMLFKEPGGSNRSPMTGSADQIREDTARLRDIGVTHLIQSPPAIGFDPSATTDQMLTLMEQLI
ncbi:MAG TPA: LLM class F420-dependent oxidoreductase [Blastocatellia bacterium]|jgi:probable F420-dependent oxidoreductase, Rv2161c family|nr:LLM class F420-dependent oxidoreductase [Blastocatellia bacterium]